MPLIIYNKSIIRRHRPRALDACLWACTASPFQLSRPRRYHTPPSVNALHSTRGRRVYTHMQAKNPFVRLRRCRVAAVRVCKAPALDARVAGRCAWRGKRIVCEM